MKPIRIRWAGYKIPDVYLAEGGAGGWIEQIPDFDPAAGGARYRMLDKKI